MSERCAHGRDRGVEQEAVALNQQALEVMLKSSPRGIEQAQGCSRMFGYGVRML